MGISALLSSVSATLAQQSTPVSVRSVAGTPEVETSAPAQTNPSASYSSPSQSVVQNASLINASSGLAQLGTLLEVAQSGTEQVSTILQQLQSLAQQASSGGDVTGLDSEFQDLLAQLDGTVSNTTFGGTGLLNGTFSGGSASGASANTSANAGASGAPTLSLPNLSTAGLFGSTLPDISTPADAQSALAALAGAQDTAGGASAGISDVISQLNVAAATVNSALANITAASSTLTENDLAESDSGGGAVADFAQALLSKPASTAQAQTANLPQSLLNLLQE